MMHYEDIDSTMSADSVHAQAAASHARQARGVTRRGAGRFASDAWRAGRT